MITSTANQQVKNLVQLKKKAKARREQGVFLVEGLKMFLEAPEDQVEQIYVSPSFLEKHEETVRGRKYEILGENVFEHVSDTQTPQGILCVVRQPVYSMEDLGGSGKPCVLVLEGIQDPGNLGTMFRSGEGAVLPELLWTKQQWTFLIQKRSVLLWAAFTGCRLYRRKISGRRSWT